MAPHEHFSDEEEQRWVTPDGQLIHRNVGDCWNCRWPMAIRGVPEEVHFCDWVCRTEWEIERLKHRLRLSEAVGPRRREGMDRYDPEMGMTT